MLHQTVLGCMQIVHCTGYLHNIEEYTDCTGYLHDTEEYTDCTGYLHNTEEYTDCTGFLTELGSTQTLRQLE